jgi:dimethylargininase
LFLREGAVDGGDVLVTPGQIFIGLSKRTNEQGAKALVGLLAEIGRTGVVVRPPPGALHLKTAASLIDEETVFATAALAASGLFEGFRVITVPRDEERAANVLRLNRSVLMPAGCPASQDHLDRADLTVVPLDVGEIGKIDGGLTCLSLRWFCARA